MAEYIEREAAIEAAIDAADEWDGGYNPHRAAQIREGVKYIPAADVVPVVRCADCKWFQINIRKDGYLPNGVPECECRHWCGPCDPTDFCSYGARMDLVTDCNQAKEATT